MYRYKKDKYDLVIFDLNRKTKQYMDCIKDVKQHSDAKVMILDFYEDTRLFAKCMKLGVDSYILANIEGEGIKYAAKLLSKGKKYFDSDLVENYMKKDNLEEIKELTKREKEILLCISKGKSNNEINITVLNNEYKDVKINNTTIRIGGMYDYAFGIEDKKLYNFLCDFQDTKNYKIMMAHRPDSFIFGDASKEWNIDLVVSGHTHGGQVRVPFKGGLYVGDQGYFPIYDKGLFDLNKIKILITSGLGSGKEKIPRFNNIPEVVNLKITNK